jgi:hypothetical protein
MWVCASAICATAVALHLYHSNTPSTPGHLATDISQQRDTCDRGEVLYRSLGRTAFRRIRRVMGFVHDIIADCVTFPLGPSNSHRAISSDFGAVGHNDRPTHDTPTPTPPPSGFAEPQLTPPS